MKIEIRKKFSNLIRKNENVKVEYWVYESAKGMKCHKCWREAELIFSITYLYDKGGVKIKHLCPGCMSDDDVWDVL